jgi:hypothetical protein
LTGKPAFLAPASNIFSTISSGFTYAMFPTPYQQFTHQWFQNQGVEF